MQCPSCRFENMPGLASCGRCGSSLTLLASDVDVHPPRASRRAKRLRRWVPRRRLYAARDAVSTTLGRFSSTLVEEARLPLPEPEVAARLLVPGWAHLHYGLVLRGRIFLGLYLALLALGFLGWGTDLGSACIGLAFSVHASSALDIMLRQGRVRFPAMMASAVLVSVVLGAAVYLPAGWVLAHVAEVRRYDFDAPPFKTSDVVLVNRWAFAWGRPRPGDVVLFEPASQENLPTDRTGIHINFRVRENEGIDRVLAGPGDRVVWEGGRLRVNGRTTDRTPLIPSKLPERLAITVPDGCYLVLPTTSLALGPGTPPEEWLRRGCLRGGQILGGAYLRLGSIQRLWFIR